jgi:phenylpyruvate tautomerase PptA (4-oxalocrotonate tautomerase family)
MPFVNISLIKGKPRDYVRAIADGVHAALVETFKVPPTDRFQVIHQLERDDFIYDPTYFDIARGDDLVFIHVTASDWRDVPTKQAFYQAVAQKLADAPGMRPEDVFIVLGPNKREDWSFGHGIAQYVNDAA